MTNGAADAVVTDGSWRWGVGLPQRNVIGFVAPGHHGRLTDLSNVCRGCEKANELGL